MLWSHLQAKRRVVDTADVVSCMAAIMMHCVGGSNSVTGAMLTYPERKLLLLSTVVRCSLAPDVETLKAFKSNAKNLQHGATQ